MITIRDFMPGDLPAVTAIYAHHTLHGTGTFDEEALSEEEMRQRHDKVQVQKLPWLIAEAEGMVAGYAYAMLFHTRHGWRFTLEDSVYVHPEQQRKGIGRALITELVDRCEVLGYRQIIAAIGDSANAGSIGVHKAVGFEEVGRYQNVGIKFGRWLDVVLMQRALGEGSATLPD